MVLLQMRLAEGIGKPLMILQKTYKTMVEMQGAAMAEAPDRPAM